MMRDIKTPKVLVLDDPLSLEKATSHASIVFHDAVTRHNLTGKKAFICSMKVVCELSMMMRFDIQMLIIVDITKLLIKKLLFF
jgi:hypothetical protein